MRFPLQSPLWREGAFISAGKTLTAGEIWMYFPVVAAPRPKICAGPVANLVGVWACVGVGVWLWTPRRSAAAAAGSDGPLPSPQVPKTARPSLFSSPGRAADRAGPTGPTARTPALPNIRTPRSFSHTMPRPSRRPFFPGAEPSPRRLVYSESSDDDSRPGGVVLHGSRPTSSEGQSRLTTPGVVVGELSSSLQSSWGFASMHSFGFSDGEDDEAPSIKRRTSTASLGALCRTAVCESRVQIT